MTASAVIPHMTAPDPTVAMLRTYAANIHGLVANKRDAQHG